MESMFLNSHFSTASFLLQLHTGRFWDFVTMTYLCSFCSSDLTAMTGIWLCPCATHQAETFDFGFG